MIFDLSVGQRVIGGFALVLLVFGGALFAVSRSHNAIGGAERDLIENIAPLRQKAVELERAVFQVAIDTRAYLISPDDLNADTQRNAVDRATNLARDLRALSKDEIGEALYRKCPPLLEAYFAAAEKAMQQRRRGTLGLRPERALGDARENAIGAIRAFLAHQEMRSREALATIAEARRRERTEAQIALGLALVLFACIAFLTARSLSRPASELVESARTFGTGFPPPPSGRKSRLSALAAAKDRPRDEMAQLARLLMGAAAVIEERNERLRAAASIAAAASCSLSKSVIADAALVVVAEHVRADAGVVYFRSGEYLTPIATYAMEEVAPVRVGEGIAGRAAESGHAVINDETDRDPLLDVRLGFADAPSKTVVAVPLISRGHVLGVLLVASVSEFDEARLAFLKSSGVRLAVGLRHALAHERLQHRAREAGADLEADEPARDVAREAAPPQVADSGVPNPRSM